MHFWIKFFERLQTKQISSDVLLSLLKSQKKMLFTYTLTVLYRHNFYHSLSSKVTLEINLTSTFAAKIGPKYSFLLYSKIIFIALNIDWDFHIFLSSIMKFKQPAKKKKECKVNTIATSLRRMIAVRIKHKSTPIVSVNNGTQSTSSVILLDFLTKSLRGLAVVHV